MNRIILSAIASLATLVTLSPATASTFPTETVSYGDLDLSTDGGRAELDQQSLERSCRRGQLRLHRRSPACWPNS